MLSGLATAIAFGLGTMLVPIGPAAASVESDSLALYGTWNWIDSSGGMVGVKQTPLLSGYSRSIQFRRDGTYVFTESDSANRYLISEGRVEVHRERGGIWLELEHWNDVGSKRERVTFQGDDTLSLYPGGGSHFVSDALSHRYVRLEGSAEGDQPGSPRPWIARPPRLVTLGADPGSFYRYTYLERSQLQPVDWDPKNFFLAARDFSYPKAVLSAYSYTRYQSPSAIIGDFDSNDTLDAAVYGHDDSLSQVRVYFAAAHAKPRLVLTSEPLVIGPLPAHGGERRPRGKIPGCFLELVHSGERVHLEGGRDVTMSRDAIRVVRIGGTESVYIWDGDRFVSMETTRQE